MSYKLDQKHFGRDSHIKSMSYDTTNGGTLVVRFDNNREYKYTIVPTTLWNNLVLAKNSTSYFIEHIRNNKKIKFEEIKPQGK